jgi:REP element-mobilizing transposase RayT
MSRRARYQKPGAVYHVMSRGNRKWTIFEDDSDRRCFLMLVGHTVRRYALKVFALCLMGNHYHLVCETPRGNISSAMQYLNGEYAKGSNRRHGRTGHLFGERFRSFVIEREGYLRRAVRYVYLNPVRAGLTATAEEWLWSTYRATAGLRPAPPWLDCEWIETAFDTTTTLDAQLRFRAYVNQPAAKIARIDTSVAAFGSASFREAIAAAMNPRTDRPVGTAILPQSRPSLADVLGDLQADRARRADLMRVAHEEHGYHLAEIARQVGLSRSTVSRVVQRAHERNTKGRLDLPDWLAE